MKAGIDLGTTLVKAAWMKDGQYQLASTAESSLEDITRRMQNDDVKDISLTGINWNLERISTLAEFNLMPDGEQTVETEIATQAAGVKELLKTQGNNLENYLLISIGSGTSYATITKDNLEHHRPGNPISGRFIEKMGALLGAKDYSEIVDGAARSIAKNGRIEADLLVEDILPAARRSLEGKFVIAHFGKADINTPRDDLYASLLNTVAVTTIRDVLQITNKTPGNVVYIGSTVARTPPLKTILNLYTSMMKYQPHFPQSGEYAQALGAYIRE